MLQKLLTTHFMNWSPRKTYFIIIVTAVMLSEIFAITLSYILNEPLEFSTLFRAFVIPFVTALLLAFIGVQFTDYLRRTQIALRKSEAENSAILEALPDLIFQLTRDGHFLRYQAPRLENPVYFPDVFLGTSLYDVYPESLAKQAMEHVIRALDTGKVEQFEYQLQHQGKLCNYEARIAKLDADQVLVIVRDITLQKQSEATLISERAALAQRVLERTAELQTANTQLVSALRVRDEFLATVSHELRTPLTAILAFADLLHNQVYGTLNTKQQMAVEHISDSGRHLLDLITDVLDFSKIEAGQLKLDIQPVDVDDLCQASLRLVRPLAEQKGVELTVVLDDNVMFLEGDTRRIKQILINLLTNAVKFTPEGGAAGLKVRGDTDTSSVHFCVWDTGIGIAEADLTRIFQPFVQLDSNLSRQYEGSGLGLALVYHLAEMHGGAIAVKSEVGHGSRFTLSLPWQPSAIETISVKQDSAVAFESTIPMVISDDPPLILVAEDNPMNRKLLCDVVSMAGYAHITAQDGTAAIDVTRKHLPDLILMDIQMPGMNGLESIQHIRADATLRHIPIIAVTALAMPGDRDRCISAGADAYLSKPIDAPSLLTTIHNVLFEAAD